MTADGEAAQPTARSGVGFWELSEARMHAMLQDSPYHEDDRYARLRGYFTSFGCTGDHLAEITFAPDRRHKNLICTLPGESPRRIVVTTFYPFADNLHGASDGWPDAVMLPMLYHALQAQPRHFTLVFAELSGEHARLHLLDQWRAADPALPVALVELFAPGLGVPQFTAIPSDAVPDRVRPNADVVRVEAWRIAYLMHFDPRRSSVTSNFASTPVLSIPVITPEGAKGIPGIIVYSSPVVQPGQSVAFSFPAFRQCHDFLGYYLADLDTRLNGSL